MRIPEKGEQPDRPDTTVLLTDPDIRRVRQIGPAQASIVVSPDRWGRRKRVHPSTIIGLQRCGTHHGGGPRRRGGVQPPPTGHTHQGE